MVEILIALLFILSSIFLGVYAIYFAYIKAHAKKPWNLRLDNSFQPKISILIPVHDEEDTIESKLANIRSVAYPKDKIEVIVADDASTDRTLIKIEDFVNKNPELNLRTITQNPRSGKSAALNNALNFSTSEIIIVSDADTYWPQNILQYALPYLSDPKVGAITGYGIIETPVHSWVTKGEIAYLELGSLMRLGESKMHSTIRFEGGFCGYKREAFEQFDCESGSDDSGTALRVVQNGFRTIFVPEAQFTTQFPDDLKGKIKVKTRRANQLIRLWIKSLVLLFQGRLLLPKKIAVPEILLFIFIPVVFFALLCVMLITSVFYPILFLSFATILCLGSLIQTVRRYIIEGTLSNIILFYALISCMLGKKFVMWNKN